MLIKGIVNDSAELITSYHMIDAGGRDVYTSRWCCIHQHEHTHN